MTKTCHNKFKKIGKPKKLDADKRLQKVELRTGEKEKTRIEHILKLVKRHYKVTDKQFISKANIVLYALEKQYKNIIKGKD